MKQLFTLGLLLLLFISCGKEKVIRLPAINHSDISEIKDVSPAYLFYDTSKKDSVDLNRKNLISTTNWLVNVDKRLTLKQAIPHIKYLQNKKQNSSHKKKGAKNFFTCNDTSKQNLGFIEFTDVIYHEENASAYVSKTADNSKKQRTLITYFDSNKIKISEFNKDLTLKVSNDKVLLDDLKVLLNKDSEKIEIIIEIKSHTSFQSYITLKSQLLKLVEQNIAVLNDEFVFN